MRNILIFQHVGHEPLGTLNPMLKEAGFRIRYVNFGRDPEMRPTLVGYNGLIILGGPMGVYDTYRHPHVMAELKLIEQALKAGIPILGICLGAQMIATVLGARVHKAERPEFGWYDLGVTPQAAMDPLFKSWNQTERVFQAHQDFFELPEGAVHLASSEPCPGQAFRYGERAYGLQFHLEADRAMIHRWLRVALNRSWVEQSGGLLSTEQIERATEVHIARSLELSAATFSQFIELFQLRQRPILLGSGHGKPTRGGQ